MVEPVPADRPRGSPPSGRRGLHLGHQDGFVSPEKPHECGQRRDPRPLVRQLCASRHTVRERRCGGAADMAKGLRDWVVAELLTFLVPWFGWPMGQPSTRLLGTVTVSTIHQRLGDVPKLQVSISPLHRWVRDTSRRGGEGAGHCVAGRDGTSIGIDVGLGDDSGEGRRAALGGQAPGGAPVAGAGVVRDVQRRPTARARHRPIRVIISHWITASLVAGSSHSRASDASSSATRTCALPPSVWAAPRVLSCRNDHGVVAS